MPLPKDPAKVEAWKKNMSEKLKKVSVEKGFGKWMKGRSLSDTTKDKISSTLKELSNRPEERKARSERALAAGNGKWMLGKKRDPRAVEQGASKRRGKSYEEFYGERADLERYTRTMSNRARWEGVLTKVHIRPKQENCSKYTAWRKAVFKRDLYTCQRCGQVGGKLNSHHILYWSTHPDRRYDVTNGITYCLQCHRDVHKREN
jgi:5-methylcytosine-specific restriction endonuclease McrA